MIFKFKIHLKSNFLRYVVTCVVMFCLTYFPSGMAVSAQLKPFEAKAIYLFKIANYIKWPDDANKAQIHYCIFGDKELRDTFDDIAKKKLVAGKQLVPVNVIEECDLVYMGNKFVIDELAPYQIAVGDKDQFAVKGGQIELKQNKNKLELIVNYPSVKESDIRLSSKLLKIATIIEDPS
ncbi:YfiR family protein [Vibrio sp. qd031]|uniref:YfiR family protein n=1 Tax=Vibrio sp. qd031 TaxID=1603038 RepID=UPI000A11559C|nr:YfiR family protein [Vibrio sp. qd031]